jgi:uncharacterized protein (DUF486 family)
MTKFYKAVPIILAALLVVAAIYLRFNMPRSTWEATMIGVAIPLLFGIFALWGIAWIMHRIDIIEARLSNMPRVYDIEKLELLLKKKD